MQPLRVFSVTPKLPKNLEPLWKLAYNLWFAWNSSLEEVFSQMDPGLWRESYQNPVRFLNMVPQQILEDLADDDLYCERLQEALVNLELYLGKKSSAISFPDREPGQPAVAYFSLEYGASLCLPIYSGGLGMLAGDHLKSASDLNAPLVGIGLLYQQGYFRQYLTPDGWQQERYPTYDPEQMPVALVRDDSGEVLTVTVDLAGQKLFARVWKADVGRIPLYLMDCNIPENPFHLRQVTSRLYGGDLEMRLWQEILLGIGGVRVLRALDLKPRVIHMNEGHSAFAGLERIRTYMNEQGLPFEAALELAASTSVFTTHTPVPAGNDRFPPELMERHFKDYARDLGLAFKVFLGLGREDPHDDYEQFCMTVLALKLSRFNNGVSLLHGSVSRNMWKKVWPQIPVEDIPIGAITNGVHTASWVAPDLALLYDRYLGSNWREDPDCARVWAQAEHISEAELWRTHERLRARLVDFARMRLTRQLEKQGTRSKDLLLASEVLNPEALTIGFARRFATYKRAGLLLQDRERLMRLVGDKDRPVQFIFAGKAHPQDNEGKKLIQDLLGLCRSDHCRLNMVFLEDYDMEVARYMVQGCDVWLNTPRRPLEACGTSGMKAMVNGVLNFSTLDGWWVEAFKPDNSVGWAIGRGEEYEDLSYQDFVESQTIYTILEHDIIPGFYDRGHGGIPRAWVRKMKLGLKELVPAFSSHRMVEDYAADAYRPAYENYTRLARDSFAPAKDLAAWRMDIMTGWSELAIRKVSTNNKGRDGHVHVGETISVRAEVRLGPLSPSHLVVEAYSGSLDSEGAFMGRITAPMAHVKELTQGWHLFEGEVSPPEAGRFGLTVRVMPHHELMQDPHSLGLIRWAEEEEK